MKRVGAMDAMFLYTDTSSTHMHIAFAGVFDPSTMVSGGDDPGEVFRAVKQLYADRLHLFPPFRWRVVTVPFNLHHPVFIEDPDFDIDYHVRRAALPAPGGRAELETFLGENLGRKLDLAHPAWEVQIVEGLEDGNWAFLAKTHHVIVDGVGGNEALVSLLDLTAEPRVVDPPEVPWEGEAVPGDLKMLMGAVAGIARQPLAFIPAVKETVTTARDVIGKKMSEESGSPKLKVIGPRTFLNGTVGPNRQVALGKMSLQDVKDIKSEVGCTVNDVVVAMTGRGLRKYLTDNDATYDGSLVASVPISVRPPGDASIENRVAGMTMPMHDDREDVRDQLQRVHDSAKPAKEQLGAISATLLTEWSEFAVPAVATQAFKFYSRAGLAGRHPPIANVTLSNVPGPPFPLYLGGSQMLSMYPLGPAIHGQRLNLTVVSYIDTLFLGIVADRDAVPAVAQLRECIIEALAEMVKAVLNRAPTEV